MMSCYSETVYFQDKVNYCRHDVGLRYTVFEGCLAAGRVMQ